MSKSLLLILIPGLSLLAMLGCEQKRPEAPAGEVSLVSQRTGGQGLGAGHPEMPMAAHGALAATPEEGIPAEAAEAYQEAQRLQRAGETEAAIEKYREALRLHDDFPTAHRALGYAYFQANDPEAAIKSYRRAVELRPDYVDAHSGLSLLYLQIGENEKAAEHSRIVEQLGARSGDPHSRSGILPDKPGGLPDNLEKMLPPDHPPINREEVGLPPGHPPIPPE